MLKLWSALQGSKTYLVGLAGIIAPIAAAIHGDMSYQAAAGVVTPSLLAMCVRHGISSSVSTIAAAVLANAAQAADSATKKAVPVLLAAILLASQLTACASLGLTGNPVADLPAIQADVVKGCQVYAKVAAPLAVAPDPTLQAYVAFGGGLCDIATGNVLATAVPNIDKNTGLWITAITGAIQAASAAVPAAPVAPTVPVAAPAKAS